MSRSSFAIATSLRESGWLSAAPIEVFDFAVAFAIALRGLIYCADALSGAPTAFFGVAIVFAVTLAAAAALAPAALARDSAAILCSGVIGLGTIGVPARGEGVFKVAEATATVFRDAEDCCVKFTAGLALGEGAGRDLGRDAAPLLPNFRGERGGAACGEEDLFLDTPAEGGVEIALLPRLGDDAIARTFFLVPLSVGAVSNASATLEELSRAPRGGG